MIKDIDRHRYLYLASISEPEDTVLRLIIEEARVEDDQQSVEVGDVSFDRCSPIISDAQCHAYEITFVNYVAYSIRNESYTPGNADEEYEGRVACIYSRSAFLDYVRRSTFATDDYPGPITHYGFHCLNHLVDVAALSEPRIELRRTPNKSEDST